MKIALDLSRFKSAGVYTIEVDQSERITVTTQSLRLLPGFSTQGPFNAPVFIRSSRDLLRFYGDIDRKLERKGSFFHRSIQTSLLTSPVFAINLLNVDASPDSKDTVEYISPSVNTDRNNEVVDNSLFVNFFNRERFWRPDPNYLQGIVNNSVSAPNNLTAPLLSISNVGTRNLSFIIRKAVGFAGFNIFAKDWYGSAENIPYEWIRPFDRMLDFFIQIIAIEGDWTDYNQLSSDPFYMQFFNAQGLIPSQVNQFINQQQINLVGSWVGTIIPDFKDQTGAELYIESIINGSTPLTGVLINVNQEALDQLSWNENINEWVTGDETSTDPAPYLIDLVGHNLVSKVTDVDISFLSYDIDTSIGDFHSTLSSTSPIGTSGKRFSINSSDAALITVGSLVVADSTQVKIPGATYVTEKFFNSDISAYVIVTAEPPETPIKVQKTIEDPSINFAYKLISLKGLNIVNRHMPGFDTAGVKNSEEGVNKIYGMLHDKGIIRGLTNPDMINFRYVVDTMAFGLRPFMGGKSWLSSLAKKRGKCTAIINAPAIKQFAASTNPFFGETFVQGVDPMPIFSTEFIASGGNPDMPRSFRFSLPDEELGSKYCGIFGPFLQYTENGRNFDVPPAADVANAYVRKFLGGNPYAIVANREGILSNAALSGVEFMIDQQDRDFLEPFGYNSIIQRPNTGQIMIYANVTGFQTVRSDYNNLHVRELLNTLEIQIEEILQNYVFDFNNAVTRLNILNSVAPVLENARDAGALERFELVMDENNNPPEIVREGFGILEINLWITGALTKIIAKYTVNTTGSLSLGGFVSV